MRLGLTEYVEGGLELEDAIEVARLLASDGLVDFINTSAGGYFSGQHRLIAPSNIADGWLIDRVASLKATLEELPVFAVGALRDPRDAVAVLTSGAADMVAMTRALIADPELVNKLRDGKARQVRRCIKSNQGCISRVVRGLPMSCTVNPAAGREGFFEDHALARVGRPLRYVVVGGGPAGMKASETLARRGHGVTLLERSGELGGQLKTLRRTPYRESFGDLVDDLSAELSRLGVDLRCDSLVTRELVAGLEFDRLIVATGARADRDGFSSAAPTVSKLPGAELDHVFTGWEVLDNPAAARGHVVLLDSEGTRESAGVAEVLLDRGNGVELVTRWNSLFHSPRQRLSSHWSTNGCSARVCAIAPVTGPVSWQARRLLVCAI